MKPKDEKAILLFERRQYRDAGRIPLGRYSLWGLSKLLVLLAALASGLEP